MEGCGCTIRSMCGISSVVYFCGKLRLAWEDVCLKSAHGRNVNLAGAVRTHEKTFSILGGADSVGKLCRELQEYGLSHVRVHVENGWDIPKRRLPPEAPGRWRAGIMTACAWR